jgi:heme/copper-type cytochrome/quinol oxidase subunit 2
MTTRAERRHGTGSAPTARGGIRTLAFGIIVVGVLVAGGYLAFGDFLDRPAAAAGAIDVQSSMAGFTPSEIRVTAGTTVTLDWWTQDAAVHLQDGVHTMISPELGLNEALPAESRTAVTWQVPDKPGTYDVWCDTCCGGKDSPTMHGKIVIEPASA